MSGVKAALINCVPRAPLKHVSYTILNRVADYIWLGGGWEPQILTSVYGLRRASVRVRNNL